MLACELETSGCAILALDQADESGVEVDDAGSIIPTNPPSPDSPGDRTPEQLMKRIRLLDTRLAKTEDDAVLVVTGQILIALTACAERDWPRRLKRLGLHPRVATRLMTIGRWGREIGLNESDRIPGLPQDPHKLEWLAKLSREQMQALVEYLDCRSESRPTIIKEVKKLLGQAVPTTKPTARKTTIEAIEKRLAQLSPLIDRIDSASRDGEAAKRVRGLLDDMARKLGPQPRE
jgi:hypothetical protein